MEYVREELCPRRLNAIIIYKKKRRAPKNSKFYATKRVTEFQVDVCTVAKIICT